MPLCKSELKSQISLTQPWPSIPNYQIQTHLPLYFSQDLWENIKMRYENSYSSWKEWFYKFELVKWFIALKNIRVIEHFYLILPLGNMLSILINIHENIKKQYIWSLTEEGTMLCLWIFIPHCSRLAKNKVDSGGRTYELIYQSILFSFLNLIQFLHLSFLVYHL